MSSEDEITPPLKRRRVIDDNDDRNESNTSASRSSERLRKKANRRFQLPTRDDVWKDIPHSTTPNKTMSRCKPRLHVNNLLKERHRYNFDPDISSGDESINDFIDDDDLLDETVSENEKQTRKRRITHYYSRIKDKSGSKERSNEERKSEALNSEDSSCQQSFSNSKSFTKTQKFAIQGMIQETEKERKEETAPCLQSDIDLNSCIPVKTGDREATKIESSDTESYPDSNIGHKKTKPVSTVVTDTESHSDSSIGHKKTNPVSTVVMDTESHSDSNIGHKKTNPVSTVVTDTESHSDSNIGQKKTNPVSTVVMDTESESTMLHADSSRSDQNLTRIKNKVQNLYQLQNDSTRSSLDVATVKNTDLNHDRSVDEHSDITITTDADSVELVEESVNESSDDEVIWSTHKRTSLVIDSDSNEEDVSNPAIISSIRKSSRSEGQMKIKSETRKNLFKEFNAARKRSLSDNNAKPEQHRLDAPIRKWFDR